MSTAGTPLAGLAVTFFIGGTHDEATGLFGYDPDFAVDADTTDATGYFRVAIHWDKDYSQGAVLGGIEIRRPGYDPYRTPKRAYKSNQSLGELFPPGWSP